MTLIGKAPAARFEISADGVRSTYRYQRDIAIESAARLMGKYPNSVVAVKDQQSGELTAVYYKSRLRLL